MWISAIRSEEPMKTFRNTLLATALVVGMSITTPAKAEHTSEGHVIGGVMMASVCMMMKRKETLGFQHIPDWLCIASPAIMAYFKEQYYDPPHASNREDMIEWMKGGLLGGGMIKLYEWKF